MKFFIIETRGKLVNYKEFEKIDFNQITDNMVSLLGKLYPICRSITGNGLRDTLKIISDIIPLKISEIPTGTDVFDWKIPQEWNIQDAYIKNKKGEKIVDFQKSNLHILNYSRPINKIINYDELKSHIFTDKNNPKNIPYRTSYYNKNWGFCMSQEQFRNLPKEDYEVVINSTLDDGSLTYGEYFIKGQKEDEILISTYVCHPSLCNDNLSGVILSVYLANVLKKISNKYSIRFLFAPETIGAIAWLKNNEKNLDKIKGGLVATCVGDSGKISYKKTRIGNTEIDRIVKYVLDNSTNEFKINEFSPIGSDERQFCSPGFNLPIGSLTRSPPGSKKFKEYHSSSDNLSFIKKESLKDSFEKYLEIITVFEENGKFENLNPKCEPFLSKRSLYREIGGQNNDNHDRIMEFARKWVLSLSDGETSVLEIANKSKIAFKDIKNAVNSLVNVNLLKEVE